MEVIDQHTNDWGGENERLVLLVTYVLHGLSFAGITALIAVIINYVKIKEAQRAPVRNPHRCLLRHFDLYVWQDDRNQRIEACKTEAVQNVSLGQHHTLVFAAPVARVLINHFHLHS